MADKQAVSIRFPLGMYDKIKESSKGNFRSFNGQVIFLLRKALDVIEEKREEQLLADELAKKLSETTGI